EEAIDSGWFGPGITSTVAARLGDVVAAVKPGHAVVASAAEPRQSSLRGMHGSMSGTEQLVPLIVVRA
ncbi:MAG: alkaline phosphatase family protein, partial [Pseudonocardiaceae bacterium]